MYLMIVEDEKFIRDGILYLLSEVPGITEIDTACDGEDAWSMITAVSYTHLTLPTT